LTKSRRGRARWGTGPHRTCNRTEQTRGLQAVCPQAANPILGKTSVLQGHQNLVELVAGCRHYRTHATPNIR
jgi:hypothetical protein